MIGEFNKENPYIIQISENIEPLKNQSMQASRIFTRNLIIGFLVSVLSGVLFFYPICIVAFIALWAINMIFVLGSIFKYTMQRSPLPEIYRILYGSQYEKIYVNNEKLLQLIEAISSFRGCINQMNVLSKNTTIAHSIVCGMVLVFRWLIYLIF